MTTSWKRTDRRAPSRGRRPRSHAGRTSRPRATRFLARNPLRTVGRAFGWAGAIRGHHSHRTAIRTSASRRAKEAFLPLAATEAEPQRRRSSWRFEAELRGACAAETELAHIPEALRRHEGTKARSGTEFVSCFRVFVADRSRSVSHCTNGNCCNGHGPENRVTGPTVRPSAASSARRSRSFAQRACPSCPCLRGGTPPCRRIAAPSAQTRRRPHPLREFRRS